MFILIEKANGIGYASKSKRAIAERTGYSYYNLRYYATKGFYENNDIIFARVELLKSKQGGDRGNLYKNK